MLIFGMLFILGATVVHAQDQDEDMQELVQWISGTYSNKAQADKNSNYSNITMHIVPIWVSQSKAKMRWLYVEQSAGGSEDKPYLQRIYRLMRVSDQDIAIDIFLLPNPGDYTEGWKNPLVFNKLKPENLKMKDGCSIFVTFDGFANFSGTTPPNKCPSDIKGAAYTTTNLVINKEKLILWDRGYDASGHQVWGAKSGGYSFDKIDR